MLDVWLCVAKPLPLGPVGAVHDDLCAVVTWLAEPVDDECGGVIRRMAVRPGLRGGDRIELTINRPIAGFANRFLAGSDVNTMAFDRIPFFRGGVDSVDPLNPTAGVFGPLTPSEYTTKNLDTAALPARISRWASRPVSRCPAVHADWPR